MAVRYFDLNGATAGFGTLTGAWDTTSAFWSTSSAGTVAPTAYTFTNADTAQFGFTGTTATAGTATISTGITVTLNSITTANLAGLQTIAAAGTGAITLAGTTPSVVVGSAGGLTISAPIGGTAGLAFSGGNVLTLSGANTFTGAFTQATGTTRIGNAGALGGATATLALSGGTISSSSTTAYTITNAGASTISGNITLGDATNTGALTFTNAFGLGGATRTLTIASAVTLSGIIGTVSDGGITKAGSATLTLGGANTFTGAFSGSAGTTVASTATSIGAAASTAGISSTGTHQLQFATAPTYSGRDVTISGTGGGFGALRFSSTSSGTNTFKSITLTGAANIQATAVASGNTQTVTTGATAIALGGNTLTLATNSGALAIDSNISGTGGVTVSTIAGSGYILLSAADSNYTGATSVQLGYLRVASLANVGVASSIGAPAIGSATISLGSTGTAGLLYNGTTNTSTDRILNLASTTLPITLGTTSTGNVTYTSNLTATGSGAKTLTFTGSSTGIVTLSGVVPDSAGGATSISVTSGTHYLSGTANTLTGTTSVSGAGVLQFNSIGNVGAGASSLGNPALANATIALGSTTTAGTIRYLGTGAASSDRIINLAGTTGGGIIEASGTGTLTFTSALTATGVGAKTFTLGGFTSGVFSGAITNASGNVISLTKSGSGSWSIPSASNTFTGNVSITGGPLTIEGANRLGGATKTVTISSSGYRNASLVLAGTGDTLASTTTLSVGSAGLDNLYFPQGAIKATSDWTVAGAVTQTGSSTFAADGGNLVFNGLISGTSGLALRAALGRTLYVNAGVSIGSALGYFVGPGVVEWKASASNAMSSQPNIQGGTLHLVSDGTVTSNPFGTFSGFSFGSLGATGLLQTPYAYTGGVAEFANTGASGAVTLTFSGNTPVTRGTANMRLNRASTAGVFTVNLSTVSAATGLVYWEYAGTPGTIGTDSKFVLTSTATSNVANTRVLGSAISNGSALVPAYRDANKVVVPMVYDGSQATVLATQAGGSSLTGASETTNHNISANITAQPSTAISSLRMQAGTSLTLTSGSILETALLMDMGTSAGTVLSGGRLARSRSQRAELTTAGLQFYTANTNGTGSTISSDIDLPYGTSFAKVGPGLVTHTGAISKLNSYNLAEGNAAFSSAGSFSGEYTGITFANPATGTNSLTLGTSGTVSVGSLSGGGANTTLALTGGDLKLTASSSGQIYSGNITRSGSQKLILRTIQATTTSANQVLSGSIDVASLDIQRGTLVLPIETGASLASAIPVNFTGVGQINIGSTTPVPIGADYSLAFGAVTVTQGLGRILFQSVTSTSNFYATRVSTSAVPTVAADGALDLLSQSPNTLTSFTVTGASAGPMGINWFNGASRAYYRTAGSTLTGGGTTPVATVDIPNYGTDANFPAAKAAGVAFTAASTDNISVTGAQSAQTSVTVASLRSSATITMASASDRITTDLFIAATTTPISGGQIATNTGRLYVYSTGTPTISSALVDNGLTPTRLVLSGANSSVLTLTGTNTFSGGIALVGSGQLSAASDTNLGTGSIDSYGGDLNFSTAGSNTITKNIAVYDGGLYLTGSTAGVKLSGIISGTGDVFVAGNGLTLQGANTNSGTLRLVGTYLADSTPLNNFSGIDFAGGTFRVTSASTPDISGKITPRTSNSIIISNASGTDYVLASSFGNSSTFTKGGVTGSTNDRVTLSAENYFTSATVGSTAAVGAVRAAATNALGWGTVTVQTGDVTATNQGAALELVGNITLPNAITLSGEGLSGLGAIRNVSGSNTMTGVITATTSNGNKSRIGADIGSSLTLSGGITATATGRIVEFYGAGTTVETGVISGGSFISVARPTGAGAGVTQLLSANTYSGGTTLTEGTIFAGNQTALGTGSVTMASGTTLQSGTGGGQNGKLTVTGTLTNNGGTIRIGG